MPVAIEFFLDEPSAAVVREVWRKLAEAGVSAYLHGSGVRPHLTLLAGERVDQAAAVPRLRELTARTPAPSVSFVDLGVSTTDLANLSLIPVVTRDLLDLHQGFYQQLAGLLEAPAERYLPGRWVPHCTLVERVPADRLARAIDLARQTPLPLKAALTEIGVVEWRPVREICAFPLQPAASPAS